MSMSSKPLWVLVLSHSSSYSCWECLKYTYAVSHTHSNKCPRTCNWLVSIVEAGLFFVGMRLIVGKWGLVSHRLGVLIAWLCDRQDCSLSPSQPMVTAFVVQGVFCEGELVYLCYVTTTYHYFSFLPTGLMVHTAVGMSMNRSDWTVRAFTRTFVIMASGTGWVGGAGTCAWLSMWVCLCVMCLPAASNTETWERMNRLFCWPWSLR